VTRGTEDATERDRRRYQRELFDGIAQDQVGLTLAAEVTMARVRRLASGD
jgi:signal transduction histidine kinase